MLFLSRFVLDRNFCLLCAYIDYFMFYFLYLDIYFYFFLPLHTKKIEHGIANICTQERENFLSRFEQIGPVYYFIKNKLNYE